MNVMAVLETINGMVTIRVYVCNGMYNPYIDGVFIILIVYNCPVNQNTCC